MSIHRPNGTRLLTASLHWLMVFLVIALSGCVYFTQVYRKETTIVLLALMSFAFLLERKRWTKASLWTAGCLLCMLVLNFCVNSPHMSGGNLFDYILRMFEILCLAGCASLLSAREFADKYVRIMEVIAVISLLCFAVQRSDLTRVYQLANTSILEGYTISWYHTWGWTYIFHRNAGPFWEPGAFQGYLFVAMLFLLKRNDATRHVEELLLLGATVLTTMSTTGYILLGIVGVYCLCRYARSTTRHRRIRKPTLAKLLLLFSVLVIGVAYLLSSPTVVDKFSLSNESYVIRVMHVTRSFSMVMERPLTGYGIMTQNLLDVWSIFGEATNSAGLFTILQYFGLVLGCLYIGASLTATVKVFQPLNSIFVCIFFLILHLTESLLMYPVYISFLFWAANTQNSIPADRDQRAVMG